MASGIDNVDPKFTVLVSTVCSNEGNVKETILRLLDRVSRDQSSGVSGTAAEASCAMPPSPPCPSLVYSTKRAVRGCASSKEGCRLSCALLLSALLRTFGSTLSLDLVYQWTGSLLNPNVVGTGKSKSDSRVIDIGRLAVFSAVLFGAVQPRLDGTLEQILKDLLDIRTRKSYLTGPVDSLLLKFVGQREERAEVCAFLLANMRPEPVDFLQSALSCLAGTASSIPVPAITTDTRDVIDCLPCLHPALKVVAGCRFDLVAPQIDGLLSSDSRDLKLVAVLLLKEAKTMSLPTSFVVLAEKLCSQGKPKSQGGDKLKQAVDELVQQYVCTVQGCTLDTLGTALPDCPAFLLRKLSLPGIEQLDEDSFQQLFSSLDAHCSGLQKAECLSLLFKSKRVLSEKSCKALARLLFSSAKEDAFVAAFRGKVASLLASCSPATLHMLVPVIAATFFKTSVAQGSDEPEGPLQTAKRAFKRMAKSDDQLVSFGCCCCGAMLALSFGGTTVFELLQELDGFDRKKDELSRDDKSTFWAETVLSLLSNEQAFVRKMAETLFVDVCKGGYLNAVSIDLLCDVVERMPDSSNNFEIDDDDEEDDDDNGAVDSSNLLPVDDNSINNDSDDALEDEDMDKVDAELATAVSMHMRMAAARKNQGKRLQAAGLVIQLKAVSLVELLSRSREIPLSAKFSVLPRLIRTLLALEAVGRVREEFAERLFKTIKGILDACKGQSEFDWLALFKASLELEAKRTRSLAIMACICSICSRRGVDIDALLRSYITDCLASNEGILELSTIIPYMANHDMSPVLEEQISALTPLQLPLSTKNFAKHSLLKSLRSIKCKRPAIAGYAVDTITSDVMAELSDDRPKAVWVRNQLSELHLWYKTGLIGEKRDKLVQLREQLSDPKLIGQIDHTLKSTENNK